VPPLRDLVALWIGERTQTRELGDRVEALRGELDGIANGMQRSAKDLGRIREEHSSPVGVQIVTTWNALVERVQRAEAAAQAAAPAGATPGAAPDVGALLARLDDLESELQRLRGDVQEDATLEILDAEPGSDLEMEMDLELEETASSAGRPTSPRAPASIDTWGEVEIVEPLSESTEWEIFDEPQDARALFGVESDAERDAGGEPFDEPAHEPAPEPARGLGREPATAPPPTRAHAVAPAPDPAATPGSPRFEDLAFPHFVGKPVRPLHDRVAVTYEGQDAAAEAAELPAGSLLFDDDLPPFDDEQPIFDLPATRPERER
jgi:hypothetical protein